MAQVDPGAVRATNDLDILIRSEDLEPIEYGDGIRTLPLERLVRIKLNSIGAGSPNHGQEKGSCHILSKGSKLSRLCHDPGRGRLSVANLINLSCHHAHRL